MNRRLFSRLRRSRETGQDTGHEGQRGISRATRIGILIGGAVVVAGTAVPAIAASGKPAPAATKAAAPAASSKHTTVKPVRGAKPAVRALAPKAATSTSSAIADTACTTAPVPTSCPIDLYALRGSITVPGIAAALPIWGFSLSPTGPATLPGPTLVAVEGQNLQITLHNCLQAGGCGGATGSEGNLALEIPATNATPDLNGVVEGQSTAYSFTSLAPGSYVYEAGATAMGQRQIAMGLAGMIVIRPANWATCANHTAYDPVTAGGCDGTAFDAESPVQLNELSSAFNTATAANPTSGDLHNYKPDVFLVNGRSFDSAAPTTGSIPVNAGDRLLLRYANLGLRERSISIGNGVIDPFTTSVTGGQRQLAADGSILKVQPDLASIYLNPVQTTDALTQVDPGLFPATLVPLYDQGQNLNHWTGAAGQEKPTMGAGIGGMMTMLQVVNGAVVTPDGPKTVVAVTPKVNDVNPGNAADIVTVTSTSTSPTSAAITQGEWFLDSLGADGSGTPITASTCAPSFCFTISPTDLQTLLGTAANRNGQHVIWVNAMDANGKWGAGGDTFSVDLSGPLVSHTSVHSTPTNGNRANDLDGSTDFNLVGTASASLSGWVVTAVEACVDAPCSTTLQSNPAYDQPTPTAPDPSTCVAAATQACYGPFSTSFSLPLVNANTTGVNDPAAPIVGFSGAIPFASLPTTTDGTHTFYIHACEAPTLPADPTTVDATNCGRWGDTSDSIAARPFVIDTAAPATTTIAVSPNPNNGFQSGNGNVADLNQERIDATFSDTGRGGSAISLAEVFISQPNVLPWCYTGPTTAPLSPCPATPPAGFFGTGAEMVPQGGAWNQVDKNGVGLDQSAAAFIPLTDVRSMPEGQVWFWVHSRDQAGNWAPFTVADPSGHTAMTLDKTMAVIDSASSSTTAGTFSITITAHDPVHAGVNSNLARVEYFVITCNAAGTTCTQDPGAGNGIAIPVPAGTGTSGSFSLSGIPNPPHRSSVFVRVMDQAGNWTIVDLSATNFAETNEPDLPVCTTTAQLNCELTEENGPVRVFP